MYLFNAFSLNMVSGAGVLKYQEVSLNKVKDILKEGFESYIGHQDMANVLSHAFGISVKFNRSNNSLIKGDKFVVAQYKGPRLPEGCILLPAGAKIKFYLCSIEE